ncbi:UNVERIFIED_CONTAM: hypothetical protein HDU68_012051 [Siphonaria sp. JEL0065]|nr:hypothetical protein HDU68_012051 [Siphonaria sp. JEL0065]
MKNTATSSVQQPPTYEATIRNPAEYIPLNGHWSSETQAPQGPDLEAAKKTESRPSVLHKYDCILPLICIYAICSLKYVTPVSMPPVILRAWSLLPLVIMAVAASALCTFAAALALHFPFAQVGKHVASSLGAALTGLGVYMAGFIISAFLSLAWIGIVNGGDGRAILILSGAAFVVLASFVPTMLYAGGWYQMIAKQFTVDHAFGLWFQGIKILLMGILYFKFEKFYKRLYLHVGVNLVSCLLAYVISFYAIPGGVFREVHLLGQKGVGAGVAAVFSIAGVPELSFRVVRQLLNETVIANATVVVIPNVTALPTETAVIQATIASVIQDTSFIVTATTAIQDAVEDLVSATITASL